MTNPVEQLRATLRNSGVYVSPAENAKLDEWHAYCAKAVNGEGKYDNQIDWLDRMLDAALPDATVTAIITAPKITTTLDDATLDDNDENMRDGESTEQYLLRRIAAGFAPVVLTPRR